MGVSVPRAFSRGRVLLSPSRIGRFMLGRLEHRKTPIPNGNRYRGAPFDSGQYGNYSIAYRASTKEME